MMGLQTAIKATTKRKYEIETECEGHEKKEDSLASSPSKVLKFSEVDNFNNKSNNSVVLKSIKSDIISPETHQWSHEPLDSISKLQAVTETWSNSTLSTTPFNCSTANTLSSLAQTAENITRSALATTLLDQDDLLDDDEDDFQDDFDFDDEDEDDLILDDRTVLVNQNYTPIKYPSPSSPRQNYLPAYPKPGYAPESYQNCSRTPSNAQYSNHQSQSNIRTTFFQGSNNGTNWIYYNHHHQHYDLASHQQQQQQQQQTIRCAENGKSYFELGNSNNYCTSSHLCGNGMVKNCCEGRNNLWCTTKQCYKEKRLKMMNLSMFKLARFRQASDQSLYRSVLICNTLKSLEKEIELENQIYHQRMQQQQQQQNRQAAIHNQNQQQTNPTRQSVDFHTQSYSSSRLQNPTDSKQMNGVGSNNLNNERIMINNCSLNTCNNSFSSQPYANTTASVNYLNNRISSFNEPMPIYEHHPLKDPSSGRATPFPSTTQSPGISQLASNSSSASSTNIDDVECSSNKSIDWGSVLSLSSQSALDPLSTDIFTSSNTPSLIQTSTSQQNSNTITNLHVTISRDSNSTSVSTSSNISNPSSSNLTSSTPLSCVNSASSSSSAPISSIITTLTTVSSCSLESLTASSISVSQSVSNSNWDFPFLESSESSSNSEYYELNCYKLSSALNQMDDFVRSEQLTPVTSSAPVAVSDIEQSHHQINIMVGS